ncbi:MAG: CHAT domain-containing protein [Gemmatimonadaceae bacterium]|nr:CHAT domain-containing protein [Gemmatimonadaceae bacterium]
MQYRNFDIEACDYVRDGDVERFTVRVLRSPVGMMPSDEAEAVSIDPSIHASLQGLEGRQLAMRDVARLGAALSALLLPPRVRDLLDKSLIELDGPAEGLRLRLRFEAPALERFPWEYMYLGDPTDGDDAPVTRFIALDRRLSIVRCQQLPDEHVASEPVKVDALTLCALFASPTNDATWPPLALEKEQQVIEAALDPTSNIAPQWFLAADSEALDRALAADPHLLHFAGHGDFDDDADPPRGALILLGPDGRGSPLAADLFAARMRGRPTRLIVLGACFGGKRAMHATWSGVASSLLGVDVPAIVAMQYDLMDDSAIAFARKVYTAIAAGLPLDAAVVDGRLEIVNRCGREERDFGVPAIYLGAHDGPLFPRLSAADAADDAETWARLLAASRAQVERQLARYRGTDATPGAYLPSACVERPHVRNAFDGFLAGSQRVLMVVDDAGMGKTTTLCRWAERLSADGHLVFFYSADAALHNGIEHELANDLALRSPDDVDPLLDRAAAIAAAHGRRLVIVVDALNDYQGRDGSDAGDLLISLDACATRTAWPAFALLGACNTTTWNRLAREGVLPRVTRDRWFTHPGGHLALQLGPFAREEFAAAWEAYARQFRLTTAAGDLSPDLALRLRRPLLLRMVAEAWAGRAGPVAATDVTLDIFDRFVTQRLTSSDDVALAERLALRMWTTQRVPLRVDEILHDPALDIEIARDGRAVPWTTLQERDIIRVEPGTPLTGDTVTFVIPAIGAYFLARALRAAGPQPADVITGLVAASRTFPLAWGAARLSLLLAADQMLYERLAGSPVAEIRELVSEAFIEYTDVEPARARESLQRLINGDDADARRTALKAAFYLGAAAHDLLLSAASAPSDTVRDDVRDVLYLIWFNEETEVHPPGDASLVAMWEQRPGFAEAFLDDLLGRISLMDVARGAVGRGELLSFFLAVTMAIYINHCDRRDVMEKTIAWYRTLAVDRLKLPRLDWIPGKARTAASKLVISVLYRKYGEQVLDALRLRDVEDGRDPFALAPPDREIAQRVIPALDPSSTLAAHRDDLATMLDSDVPAFRILAALPIGVHACAHPAPTIALVDDLRAAGSPRSRLWLLLAFTVLANDTPDEWIPALERWTTELAQRDRAILDGTEPSLLTALDAALLPLGLALGKRAREFEVVERLMRAAATDGDHALLARLVRALGVPGFYHPHPVLLLLARCMPLLSGAESKGALESSLGLMRTKHRTEVDTFLLDASLGDDASRRVRSHADPRLVRQLIWYVGLFNHGVFCAHRYPRMRTGIVAPCYELVANAPSAQAFALEYSTAAESLFWKSRFDLREWTLPEPWA